MTEIKLPDYLFVYGILRSARLSTAVLGGAVKVRKAYNNMHVCLECHEHGEVDGCLLPVMDAEHLAYLDRVEGSGYRRVDVRCNDGAHVQTYWYKDMPLNVDTSTGEPALVIHSSFITDNSLTDLHRKVYQDG